MVDESCIHHESEDVERDGRDTQWIFLWKLKIHPYAQRYDYLIRKGAMESTWTRFRVVFVQLVNC